MQHLVRIGVFAATVLIMVGMTFVPPWREYQIHLRDPLPYVTEYKLLPTYAWYDHPPPPRGQGHGYQINYGLLCLQVLVAGIIGSAIAFGRRGAIIASSVCGGGLLGLLASYALMPAHTPHAGWVPSVWILIIGFTTLMGAALGLAIGIGVTAIARAADREHSDRKRRKRNV